MTTTADQGQAPSRPNIVLILTDQQRHDQLGSWSDGFYETPNLDRLADAGTRFDTAYTMSTLCAPARGSLLTGLYPNRFRGHRDDRPDGGGRSVREGFWTIAHQLGHAGYATAHVGKGHFKPMRADHGFEHLRLAEHLNLYRGETPPTVDDHVASLVWAGRAEPLATGLFPPGHPDAKRYRQHLSAVPYPLPEAYHPTSWVTDEAIAWLQGRDDDRPFFLQVSYPHPHTPYNPPATYADRYDPADVVLPDPEIGLAAMAPQLRTWLTTHAAPGTRIVAEHPVPTIRTVLTYIRALITQIDDAVGRLLAELDLTDTVVLFCSDHGDFGAHRGLLSKVPCAALEDLARVPMFVSGAGVTQGQRVTEPVSSGDLAPTVCELAGAGGPLDQLDGRSVLPSLIGPDRPTERTLYTHSMHGYPMARRGRMKLVGELLGDERMLFDVEADPLETVDLAAEPEHRGLVADLFDEILRIRGMGELDLERVV
ncbi:MAG: sulfatase-like hydrolase/transferase [Acidimicrobiia bacterium]|nr:sulfatase-like hydrolase/transferase [Acidimicrobiia bacterium]